VQLIAEQSIAPTLLQPPADPILTQLLDRYAPYGPAPLVPELSVFYGRSLIEIWEAAERVAGGQLPAPFWAYPWAAGVALARVVLDHAEWVRGLHVLDFGCGGGIAALAAARAGAAEVTANDLDPWALATTRIAAARQALSLSFCLSDLTTASIRPDGFDVVLCSDLAYEKGLAPKQRAFLERMRHQGARVLVADAGRTHFTSNGLRLIQSYTVGVPKDLEGVETRIASVFEMLLR
jgi:predicted nicotinamide N-methyase